MASLNAFLVAVELAERQRDEARQALQDARNARQAAQQQLDQIESYAQETQNRWGLRADAAVKPEVMYHHYQFMDRLAYASGLQSSVVGDQAGRVDAAAQVLLQAELRVTSLKKVVEKRKREMEHLQSRRDQKQTDERASLQFRSAGSGPSGQEF